MIRFAATTCALALAGMAVSAPVKMIFDTDMLTDFAARRAATRPSAQSR